MAEVVDVSVCRDDDVGSGFLEALGVSEVESCCLGAFMQAIPFVCLCRMVHLAWVGGRLAGGR